MDFDPSTKTFRLTTGEDNDTVVIGNGDRSDRVDAHIALERWGGEESLRLWYPGRFETAARLDSGKALFRGVNDEFRIYQLPDGGIEFELTLLTRPRVSEWEFHLDGHRNFELLYQHELTAREIEEAGEQRPANVIGSYAIYHKTKAGHVLGQTDYRCGKAFHIYRPEAVDRSGARAWGTITIDSVLGTLTVSFDPAWLAAATYPVVIDPNLGYDSVGASSWSNQTFNWWLIAYNVSAGSDGTATSLWFAPNEAQKYKIAVYDGTSTIANRITNSYEDTSPTADIFNEVDISGESLAISNGTSYYTAFCGDDVGSFCGFRYDSGSGGDSEFKTGATYTNEMLDPKGASSSGSARVSMYLEYTTAGGNAPTSHIMGPLIGPMGGPL